MKKCNKSETLAVDAKEFHTYMKATRAFFKLGVKTLAASRGVDPAVESIDHADVSFKQRLGRAKRNIEKIVQRPGRLTRLPASNSEFVPKAKKGNYVLGAKDFVDGTKLHTIVRMKGKAAGTKRRVSAKVKGGKVYIEGHPRGYNNLSRALYAARGVAGKADREYSSTTSSSAWHVTDAGCTVLKYRSRGLAT